MRRTLIAIIIVALVVVGLLFLAKPWSGGTGTVTHTASTYSKASWSWERLGRGVARILYGDRGVVYLTKDDLDYVLRGGVLKIPNPPDKRFGYCVVRYDQSTDSIVVACGPSYWDTDTVVLAVPVDQILYGTSNATTLATLSGVLHCLDGEEITRGLWLKMRDFSASDPRIAPYIEWLRNALAPNPSKALNVSWYPGHRFWWFSDRYVWRAETPSNGSIVRMGLVKLPFGAGIVVTAYQVGSHVDIVVHGTIVNETEWRILLARKLMFYGGDTAPSGELYSLYHDVVWRFGDLVTQWVLWRMELDARSNLVVGNTTLPVRHVYVLLEMPAYIFVDSKGRRTYMYRFEALYWATVGYPTISLALRLASPENVNPLTLYEKVKDITLRLVATSTHHCMDEGPTRRPDFYYPRPSTPFLLRAHMCGVCEDYSDATALFASNAIGAVSSVLSIDMPGLGHAISVLVYPSSLGIRGTIQLPFDVDNDGRNDTGTVIIDTAKLSVHYINTHIGIPYLPDPPFSWTKYHPYLNVIAWSYEAVRNPPKKVVEYLLYARSLCYWTGVVKAIEELPDWLQAPWMKILPESLKPWNKSKLYMEFVERWWFYSEAGARDKVGTPAKDPEKVVELGLNRTYFHALPLLAPPDFWEKVLLILLEKAAGIEDFVPPSVALALNRTMDSIPLVFEGRTPSLREVLPSDIFQWRNLYEGLPSSSTPSNTGGSSSSSQQSQKHRRIEAVVVLDTVYSVVQDPVAGEVLVADRLRGTTIVDGTNITVVAVPINYDWMGGRYKLAVYVNGSRAYGDWWGLQLPTTISFERRGVKYVVRVEPPKPLVLDKILNMTVLEPMDSMTVLTKDGEVNVTIYGINETIRLGNVTVLVIGDVSRLGVHLDIYIFGVPPTNYSATPVLVLPNGTAITMNATVEYIGHLHIQLCYDVPMDEEGKYMLLPQGTVLRIPISPLNLAIEVPVEG